MITCTRQASVEKDGEHFTEYHYLCDDCGGTTITPDPTPHCAGGCRKPPDELTRLLEQNTQLRAIAEAARRLVAALPKCHDCDSIAMCQFELGSKPWCVKHSPYAPEYPHAQPLRDTIAALEALETK